MPGSNILEKYNIGRPFESGTKRLDWSHGVSPKLLSLILDITNFADVLNGNKLDPLDYSEASSLLLHRLIQFAPLRAPRPIDRLDNQIHLTLLAFMTALLPEYSHNYLNYDLLCNHLNDALGELVLAASQSRKLIVWALFVGGVSLLNSENCPWLRPLLAEKCKELDFHSWLDVHEILCECSWINAVHEKPGKELWEVVKSL